MGVTIGVFDSGIGGLSVARAIKKKLPNYKLVFKNDTDNVPYGTKTAEELSQLVLPILHQMIDVGCDVIVIACNTVTTTIINDLRKELSVPLIGMEPMIKPASEKSKSKIIAVFATPATLSSKRYAELKNLYAQGVDIIEPNCSDWSQMIEARQIDQTKIRKISDTVCKQGADVIVLGCTHYHWIEELIKQTVGGRAIVLQPEEPVIIRLKQTIMNLKT